MEDLKQLQTLAIAQIRDLRVFLHSMIFRSSVYANPATLDRAAKIPGRAKLAAILSLLLWTGIACAGRAIGYIEPPLERIHAGLPGYSPPSTGAD